MIYIIASSIASGESIESHFKANPPAFPHSKAFELQGRAPVGTELICTQDGVRFAFMPTCEQGGAL